MQAQTAADVHFPVGSWICVQGEKWGVGWGEDLGVKSTLERGQDKLCRATAKRGCSDFWSPGNLLFGQLLQLGQSRAPYGVHLRNSAFAEQESSRPCSGL